MSERSGAHAAPAPAPRLTEWLRAALAPEPCPAGMTSREIVKRSVEYRDPPRIPYAFIEPLRSDFFETAELDRQRRALGRGKADEGGGYRAAGEVYTDEWGVRRQATGGYFDRVIEHPLAALKGLDDYPLAEVADPRRFEWLAPHLRAAHDAGKYVVAADPVLLYERLRELLGFESLLLAPLSEREAFEGLLDRLTDLSVAAIEAYAQLGNADAFMTWQDFGIQTGLPMRIESFREIYAPRLARIADAAHAGGMHFIWHCCGHIVDLIPEMIEIGVDVLQLDQPRLLGHDRLAEAWGGKLCFWNTLDIQWAAGGVAEEALRKEVAAMTHPFAQLGGGLMVRHYPFPRDVELSPEFHAASSRAFFESGCAL
ncbi:MAG: hypothetical protein JRG96_09745 [Deltaproteobacteria bacterium]|nr:hypothetical protein [Deltaproteobacteria bacterium]